MLNAEKSRSSTPGSVLNGKYFRGGASSSPGSNPSKLPWFIVLLICVKFFASVATFLLADVFTASAPNHVPLTADVHYPPTGIFGRWSASFQCLAVIQLCTGCLLIVLQKPFGSGSKVTIGSWEWFRIARHAVVSIVVLVMWTSGLQLAGPLRTIFVGTQYDYTLAGIFTAFCVVKSGVRLRGAFLLVAGIFVLLLFDHPTEIVPTKGTTTADDDDVYVTKRSVGLIILVFSLVLKLGFSAVAKNLALDLGGSKRLHALSTITSGVILVFLAVIDLMAGADLMPLQANMVAIVFVVLFGFVAPFYVDSACLKRMEASKVARIGSIGNQLSAIVLSLVWVTTEAPSMVTLFSCMLIILGTFNLTSSEKHPSGGGSFVGYSSDGLPLFNFSSPLTSEVEIRYLWKDVPACLMSALRQIQEDGTSRKIFYFFLINLTFTCVEFLCGTLSNSLGLISDGFHMLFDTIALLIGLCAAVMCRWQPTPIFPFGYGRVEVISGFINTLFLMVVAMVVFVEALDRLFDPPTLLDTHRLLPVSIMGLIVNLCGIFAFRSSHMEHSHNNVNVKGVFLHILADTMGSIGVIISSFVIHQWGILIVDPLCSLVVAVLVVMSIWPLLKDTGKMLLLTVPAGLEKNIQQALLQILAMEGVRGYKNPRFWTHAVDVYTGSLHVQVTDETNEQQVIRHINSIFSAIGFSHFVVQVEKDEFIASKNKNTIEIEDDLNNDEDNEDSSSLCKSDFLVTTANNQNNPIRTPSTKTVATFKSALV